MSSPIPHHLAGGIHPGAFVQATAPDTSDVQDGVLWVDTSPDAPPYQLKVWRASIPAWQTVGIVTSGVDSSGLVGSDCLTFPLAAQICNPYPEQVQVRIEDGTHTFDTTGYYTPFGARIDGDLSPTIFPRSVHGASRIVDDPDLIHQAPEGDYSLVCTLHTADFESEPLGGIGRASFGPPGSGGPFTVQIAINPDFAPYFPIGAPLPAPFIGISWYIVPYPGVDPPPGILGHFATTTTNDWVYIRPGDGLTPPTRDRSRTPIMRFLHDGSSLDMVLPFDNLSTTPDVLVGKNPLTNLPAYCPKPVAPTALPATGWKTPAVPAPLPLDADTTRCGVALAMATKLEGIYANISSWLNGLEALVAGLLLDAVMNLVIEAITDGGATPWLVTNQGAIKTAARFIIVHAVGSDFPPLTSGQNADILSAAFCAIPSDVSNLVMTDAIIADWQSRLTFFSADFPGPGFNLDLLGLLIGCISTDAWQQVAYHGAAAPSSACAGISCP